MDNDKQAEFAGFIVLIDQVKLYAEIDLSKYYPDLDKEFEQIRNQFKRSKGYVDEKILDNLQRLLDSYYLNYLVEYCELITDSINSIKNNTQDFSDVIADCEDMKKFVKENQLSWEDFEEKREKMKKILSKAAHKHSIHLNNKKLFWSGIKIGGAVGFATAVIVGITFHYFGLA